MKIVFNNPFFFDDSIKFFKKLISSKNRNTAGGHFFFKKCNDFLEKKLNSKKVIVTNSCTSSLEISAMLLDLKKNDEVIMPSYTFVSTANAFVLRGAKPVFVDIKKETLNINEDLIEKAITNKTKAIVVVHYAGQSANMHKIVTIAKKYNLYVVEDAAQALFSKYEKNFCGTIGDLGCFSFHETKNLTSGEGGALSINNKKLIKKLGVIINKGTDRETFNKNLKKFYSWKGIGSSMIPSEFTCALIYSQIKNYNFIFKNRRKIWLNYKNNLKKLNQNIVINQINVEKIKNFNFHMYYLIIKNKNIRDKLIKKFAKFGIMLPFHYIPLHISAMGKKYKSSGELKNTNFYSKRIIRLPIWIGVNQKKIIKLLLKIIN